MRSGNTSYISRLDHLRFLAASLVVLFHVWLLSDGASRAMFQFPIINQGHVGVPLFMVISGFILSTITYDKKLETFRFYLNRILRIYPLLIFIVALGFFSTPDPRPTSVFFDFFSALSPFSNIARLQYGEFGGQLWTIAVELQFYLLFPFLHLFLKKYGIRYHLCLIVFLIAIRAAIFVMHRTVYDMSYLSLFGCLDIFLAGQICGHLFCQGRIKLGHPAWLFGIVAFITLVIWNGDRRSLFDHTNAMWIVWPDILAVIFAAVIPAYIQCRLRVPLSDFWALCGRYSYSIYLWHIFIIALFAKIYRTDINLYVLGAIILIATTALSALSYHLIEKPFLDLRIKYTKPDNSNSTNHRLPSSAA